MCPLIGKSLYSLCSPWLRFLGPWTPQANFPLWELYLQSQNDKKEPPPSLLETASLVLLSNFNADFLVVKEEALFQLATSGDGLKFHTQENLRALGLLEFAEKYWYMRALGAQTNFILRQLFTFPLEDYFFYCIAGREVPSKEARSHAILGAADSSSKRKPLL